MYLSEQMTESLVYGGDASYRYTQDTPVLADVWIQYARRPTEPQDLLLTPRFGSRAGEVSKQLRGELRKYREDNDARTDPVSVAYNQVYVAATMWFDEMVRVVMPRTRWWHEVWNDAQRTWGTEESTIGQLLESHQPAIVEILAELAKADATAREDNSRSRHVYAIDPGETVPADLLWLVRMLGSIQYCSEQQNKKAAAKLPDPEDMFEATIALLDKVPVPPSEVDEDDDDALLWLVNLNRPASTAVSKSRQAIKADAANHLFSINTSHISWAIIDSGIDARHPAFWRADEEQKDQQRPWFERTRVTATYDFTRVRHLLDPVRLEAVVEVLQHKDKAKKFDQSQLDKVLADQQLPASLGRLLANAIKKSGDDGLAPLLELKDHLKNGRAVDWDLLDPFLKIEHDDAYDVPKSAHGTHVAGILAANWDRKDERKQGYKKPDVIGVCPDIRLYDLRVLDPEANNDEFAVLAALQFTQWLNSQKDFYAVHGVNLSLSIPHAVANFACGRTPVCDQCAELVGSGVVVVAAAGNEGYLKYQTQRRNRVDTTEGYHTVSITDPGNSSKVITVGSTHRFMPHTYGVSYFSSRGPTGDGRLKPDIVAPGEKIWSVVPNGAERRMDGTSMSAPHVSGAAAMLLARHAEMIGQPDRVKEILCSTATDLGREHYFQGAGMLDVLRALQSI
jgi:subtilisin family serine protease